MIGNDNINTWEEFKTLDLEEQVQIINNLLLEGYTVPKISESLEGKNGKALDRTVMRKHFLRFGYRMIDNVFVLDEAIEVQESKPKQVRQVKQVTESYKFTFKDEDVEILQRVIREYKLKDSIVDFTSEEDKGESSNRNIRVYTAQYQEFAEFCKINHLKQADALYYALDDFMKKYK